MLEHKYFPFPLAYGICPLQTGKAQGQKLCLYTRWSGTLAPSGASTAAENEVLIGDGAAVQGCERPWFCLNPNVSVLALHLITSKANYSRKVRFVFFFLLMCPPAWIIRGGFFFNLKRWESCLLASRK